VEHESTTAREQREGESLDRRPAEEHTDPNGHDIGIDGDAVSVEEATVHRIPDKDDDLP
jgi:hypothetical protein